MGSQRAERKKKQTKNYRFEPGPDHLNLRSTTIYHQQGIYLGHFLVSV